MSQHRRGDPAWSPRLPEECMHRHGKTAALLLLACASQLAAAAAMPTAPQAKAVARPAAPEVRTRGLLLAGATGAKTGIGV